MCIVVMKYHLMEKVSGVLVMILLKNYTIFGVNNSSSSHTGNLKSDFLILGEGPTFGINGRFGASEKKIDISFSKAKTKFFLSLHYSDNS